MEILKYFSTPFRFHKGDFLFLIEGEVNKFVGQPQRHNDKGDDPPIPQGGYTKGMLV